MKYKGLMCEDCHISTPLLYCIKQDIPGIYSNLYCNQIKFNQSSIIFKFCIYLLQYQYIISIESVQYQYIIY